MISDIKAVVFDIDGTMYANWRLYLRITGYFISNLKFFFYFNKVRHQLHTTAPIGNYLDYQARLLSKYLRTSTEIAKQKIDDICYEGLKPYFAEIKPFKNMYETVCAFKAAGLKIAVLSDFPPEQKGRMWGVRSLCDVCLGTEEIGALKPSVYPFGVIAQKLELEPKEILYVGNSIKYDVRGSKAIGMKSAYKMSFFRSLFNRKCVESDISFKTYRQLKNIVLQ